MKFLRGFGLFLLVVGWILMAVVGVGLVCGLVFGATVRVFCAISGVC